MKRMSVLSLTSLSVLVLLLGTFVILRCQIVLSLSTNPSKNSNRRQFFRNAVFIGSFAKSTVAQAKSRTDGYGVQHTDREWSYILDGAQYNILRQGGTERQKSSILNTFSSDNVGTYICAACNTPLFMSDAKFSSGTGWPSFASATSDVEVEQMDPIRATLGGRELRCQTCGGHLGDVFNDGWIYVGTEAAKTGQRYCIDGAALIFKPKDGGEDVIGSTPPPNKSIQYQSSMYRDTPRLPY